jgi:protein-tyrosine-phosphatase
MATGELEKRVLIARDASDLAFRIGQAAESHLLRLAQHRAVDRNSELVQTADVVAALAELHLAEACRIARVINDGERQSGGAAAA